MRRFLLHVAVWFLCVPVSIRCWADSDVSYEKSVQAQARQVLDKLQSDGDFDSAEKSLGDLFDDCCRYVPEQQPQALTQADFALRVVRQLHAASSDERAPLLKYLLAHREMAGAIAFLAHPLKDEAGVEHVLYRLIELRGNSLEQYATLAAAIAVVYHQPFELHINENHAKSNGAAAIFDYFSGNENRMFFGIRKVPAELLEYVVDTTASVEDLNWALGKYAGDRNIGRHFFDVPYDYNNFLRGTPKKITSLGFTLPNILRYGGVCADQAYFASEIAKAIGVPSAYDTGSSAEVAHAWVGFLQTDGHSGWWNFESGRYEEYQGVRGNVRDPVSRKDVPDSYVSMLGELIKTSAAQRYNAVALTDAAQRLIEWEQTGGPATRAALQGKDVRTSARQSETSEELSLLEAALNQSPGYAPAWFAVRDLAAAHKLSDVQKNRWAEVLLRLGAKRYPDFTLAILTPMIQSIDDPNQQDRLWNSVLFPLFQNRYDLAATVRMHEAAMWEEHDQPERAGQCYMDVINRYASAGPFVIEAIKGAEKILNQVNHPERVVALYAKAWSNTRPPQQMAQQFGTQSVWYRVGKMYARKLRENGDATKADLVETQLRRVVMVASP